MIAGMSPFLQEPGQISESCARWNLTCFLRVLLRRLAFMTSFTTSICHVRFMYSRRLFSKIDMSHALIQYAGREPGDRSRDPTRVFFVLGAEKHLRHHYLLRHTRHCYRHASPPYRRSFPPLSPRPLFPTRRSPSHQHDHLLHRFSPCRHPLV